MIATAVGSCALGGVSLLLTTLGVHEEQAPLGMAVGVAFCTFGVGTIIVAKCQEYHCCERAKVLCCEQAEVLLGSAAECRRLVKYTNA